MISIKRYLEQKQVASDGSVMAAPSDLLPVTVAAYRSALVEMGNCGLNVCPALGDELQQGLNRLGENLGAEASRELLEDTEHGVREQLQAWGMRTAMHYKQKTNEVKDILLVMAHTAESVGERDQRCAQQITDVTTRLRGVANLEDLTEIRQSIKKSATDLKTSIDRMTAEGKAVVNQLKAEITTYQARLEEAEQIASRDALTKLHSRLWVEGQIEKAFQGAAPFCIAIVDLDGFKQVNDEYGHTAGDEVLKKFSAKMRSVCRVTDTLGRWGGDEFIILLHCGIKEAKAQMDRLQEWVCGNYSIQVNSAVVKLRVDASIGLSERVAGESYKELLDRADAAMYRDKATAKSNKA